MKRAMTERQMYTPSESYNRLQATKSNGAEDPYIKLSNSIICFAADDYRMALKSGDKKLRNDLEKFFNSKWCKLLCGKLNPRHIMESILDELVAEDVIHSEC